LFSRKRLHLVSLFAASHFQSHHGIGNPLERDGREIANCDVRLIIAEERA
jgi:hypothetical protein